MPITLNNNQSPEELNHIYDTDYYWYLKTTEFRESFIAPLARRINNLGLSCLDVGCGEGWLADYVQGHYTGIDGSLTAIQRARVNHPNRRFEVDRFENPELVGRFGVIVFGGILDVLVAKESYLELIELYRSKYNLRYFIVYDLERFDDTSLREEYILEEEYHAFTDLDIQEVKKHRKILVFECK